MLRVDKTKSSPPQDKACSQGRFDWNAADGLHRTPRPTRYDTTHAPSLFQPRLSPFLAREPQRSAT